MNIYKKRAENIRGEAGAVAILVALFLVALLVVVALVVDLGLLYDTKRDLQTAADAAALAGAWELPNAANAKSVASVYVDQNDLLASRTATTPYNGDAKKILVVCTQAVPPTFARVIPGYSGSEVSARAVARIDQWAGGALPFINLDDDYTKSPKIELWEKVTPGDFESMWKDEYDIINPGDPATLDFVVHWQDGVELKKGVVATIKQEIGYIFDRHGHVYVISLRADVMASGQVRLTDGSYEPLSKLKNKDNVDPSQIVLLECTFDAYDFAGGNGASAFFTVLKVFDIGSGVYPPATVRLIE